MFYRRYGKRIFDLLIVVPSLLVLFPFFLLISMLVRARLGSPVLFRQQRPGIGERIFLMYKFRTMTDATDASGNLLNDTERLTPFGRKLRSTSLDELPELLNVLRGEMSLVGPRPLLTRYTPYFTEPERLRFSILPGITGLAQVSGRNNLPWDDRIAYDIRYAKEMSFAMDCRILLMTVAKVFKRDGLQTDPGAAGLDFDVERRLRNQEGRKELHA
jgi:lipopolysaccharide/colanic/teichoic acid biosynthesis glycosyltransferase